MSRTTTMSVEPSIWRSMGRTWKCELVPRARKYSRDPPVVAAAVERATAGNCHVRGQVDRDERLEVAQVEGPHLGVLARRFERREATFEAQLDVLEAVERRVRDHHEPLPGRHDDDVALARGAHRVVGAFRSVGRA